MERESPYVGPRPFGREDENLFFGRNREANELALLVIAHREVVLYGLSGVGKTSLINAGLLRRLEKEEEFEILGPVRVQGAFPEFTTQNIFVFHMLLSLAKTNTEPQHLARMSLRDFLRQRSSEEECPKPRLLIFDQFEEIFTVQANRWRERQGFFEQVRDALNADPVLRSLFVMRAEYVGRLDRYARILPEKFRRRFYLEYLTEESAVAAITEPAKRLGRPFVQGAAEQIVTNLTQLEVTSGGKERSEFVEPVQLQIVCQTLWRKLPSDTAEITAEHLRGVDLGSALLNFYENALCEAAAGSSEQEAKLRHWFERELITQAGTRALVFRDTGGAAGLPSETVDKLEGLRLLRSEERCGGRWYELTHDRFVEVIQKSNKRWAKRFGQAEVVRQWLEEKATCTDLLDEAELEHAEKFFQTPEAKELGLSLRAEQLLTLSRQSILKAKLDQAERQAKLERQRAEAQGRAAEAEKNLRRRDRRHAKLIIGALISIAVLAIYAYSQYNELSYAKKMLAEKEALSNERLEQAKHDLVQQINGEASALHHLASSLYLNPANLDAARLTWKLLTETAWCLPVTPPLRYSGAMILAATFSPEGKQIFAVSSDGKLLECEQDSRSPKLEPIGDPLFENVVSGTARQVVIQPAAFFSDDGTALITILPRIVKVTSHLPGPADPNVQIPSSQAPVTDPIRAEIRRWLPEKHVYDQNAQSIDLEGTSPYYFATWSADARNLVVITYTRNYKAICQVLRVGADGRTYSKDEAASRRLNEAEAIAIAFSRDASGQIAAISSGNKLQFYDSNFQPIAHGVNDQSELQSIPTPARIASGPSENEITLMAWGAGVWRFNTATGRCDPVRGQSFRDQMPRLISTRGGPLLVAKCLYRRVEILDKDEKRLTTIPINEPSVGFAQFRLDGKELLTLSGGGWNAMDTIRITSLETLASGPALANTQFGETSLPAGFAELANALSGQQGEDVQFFWTSRKLIESFSKEKRSPELEVIWERFFGKQS
ncbi:MAG: hypothetical protein WB586_00140 [Chthoniobacterales bacterium]